MKYFWISLLAIVLGAVIILYMFRGTQPNISVAQETLYIGNTSVAVDVASTTAARERGLSGRAALPAGRGMLFVFQEDGFWGFWMNDMNFPIDIIWADASGRVITVASSVSPYTYPKVFYPAFPARYVLEVPAGFAQMNGIVEGAQMSLPRSLSQK